MSVKRITVIGAGNGGHAMAAHKTLDGFEVTLFELPRFADRIAGVLETGQVTVEWPERKETVQLYRVTTDIAAALEGAQVVLVVTPAFGHKPMAQLCAPHVQTGQIIVLMPGTGGSLEFARVFQEKAAPGVLLAEAVTLPYGARVAGPGHVLIHTEAVTLPTGVFPAKHTAGVIARLQEVYAQIVPTANALEAAINNPNPVVHPAATLLSATRIEFSGGEFYLYREAMTPSVARVYEALERERLALLDRLGLKMHHYADLDARGYNLGETLDECRQRILNTSMDSAFGSGSIEVGRQMRGPSSMQDRYITEDVPMSLVPIAALAQRYGVSVRGIESIIRMACIIHSTDYWRTGRTLDKLGIENLSVSEVNRLVMEGDIRC